jgi:hypothetical protein
MASNEKEISQGKGAAAMTLDAFRGGAVGFIDWLDLFVSVLKRPLSRRVQIVRGVETSPEQRDSAEWQSV